MMQKMRTRVIERFTFPRQGKAPYRTLGDYLRPIGDEMDYVAFLSVTVGEGVRDIAEEWKAKGDYLRSHAIQSLALELAEGLAEKHICSFVTAGAFRTHLN